MAIYKEATINTSVASEAIEIVTGRRDLYGPPQKGFEDIAAYWNAHLQARYGCLTAKGYAGVQLDARDVALMMVGLKLAREGQTHHRDNLVDGVGYLINAEAVTP